MATSYLELRIKSTDKRHAQNMQVNRHPDEIETPSVGRLNKTCVHKTPWRNNKRSSSPAVEKKSVVFKPKQTNVLVLVDNFQQWQSPTCFLALCGYGDFCNIPEEVGGFAPTLRTRRPWSVSWLSRPAALPGESDSHAWFNTSVRDDGLLLQFVLQKD